MNRQLFTGLLCLTGLLAAHAFVANLNETGQVRRWKLVTFDLDVKTNIVNRATGTIRYFLAADAYSTTNTTAELNAARAAFAQWQAVSGTILKFEEGGLAPAGVEAKLDDTNVIYWTKHTTLVNNLDDISNIPAKTFPWVFDDNTLAEADIVLNGVDFRWFTDFNAEKSPLQFVESTVLHEIGHLIGLDHSPVGGATMFWRGLNGVNPQAGLSSDEVAAARFLYPLSPASTTNGNLRGKITLNGVGVFGAVVSAENLAGNLVSGTVSQTNGTYELLGLPPGTYLVRVTPLDPSTASPFLMRGAEISADHQSAVTTFLPTTNRLVVLSAGANMIQDFSVVAGNPPFRISHLAAPATDINLLTPVRSPVTIGLGASHLIIGVYGPNLPTSDATLMLTGDGLTQGETLFPSSGQAGLNLMVVSVSIATNATPGLRSLVVQQGANTAYANGFLEILPPFPDYNFDGLDDRFQRRYFSLFTSAQAGPNADPDGDGFTNAREFAAGSDPTDPLSVFFKIVTVQLTPAGTTITFESGPGKRYQVFSRRDVANDPWQPVGSPALATQNVTAVFDASATNEMRFYRAQVLP